MITLTRRLTVAVAVLSLAAAAAGCGGGGDDESDVASIDGNEAAAPEEESDGGGGTGGPDSQEFRDAMLEYAECMRDHGIDMPDPEFDEGGGAFQLMPEGEAGGHEGPSEEFQAADEACQPILEEAMPEAEQLSPEEQAERQDQMLAMAQCMRDKGYDMPDPQVDSNGRFRVERRAGAASGDGPPEDEEKFREDMEACSEEAGLPDGPAGGGGVTRGSGG
jgi:hypothetical protein